MSRLFGGHGFVSVAAVGGDPDEHCALCYARVDRLGWLHLASERCICRHCYQGVGRDTERLAARLAAMDEGERRVEEAVGRQQWGVDW